jgi:hypothetical protein
MNYVTFRPDETFEGCRNGFSIEIFASGKDDYGKPFYYDAPRHIAEGWQRQGKGVIMTVTYSVEGEPPIVAVEREAESIATIQKEDKPTADKPAEKKKVKSS